MWQLPATKVQAAFIAALTRYNRQPAFMNTVDTLPLAGLHKLSCVDYPGELAAVLFTQGCNFHCPYCHNHELVPAKATSPLLAHEEVFAFLRKRVAVLGAVVISGGEPCLHSGLGNLCRNIKSLGYKIKLDTNGSRPQALRELIDNQLIDYAALDIKSAPDGYFRVCGEKDAGKALRQSLDLLRSRGLPHEVRSTCVAPFISEEQLPAMAALAGSCPWFFQKANLTPAMEKRGASALPREAIEALVAVAQGLGADARIR